ncbi:hypothetical protein ACIBAI_01790 [Streptomyces sp. NPDC051041]|uniref:hypothetical protein n=1 Tax=Streptomyces sp. NPDC051041 TaxID=3365640 RepID=UPI00379C3493
MAAPAHFPLPAPPEPGAEPSAAPGRPRPCVLGAEAPLTSEPPLPDAEPLTSEPPLADAVPLTSEPAAAAADFTRP